GEHRRRGAGRSGRRPERGRGDGSQPGRRRTGGARGLLMDANRLRFHMLAGPADWVPEVSVPDQRVAVYDGARRTLRLGSLTDPRALAEATDPITVGPRLVRPPA